MRALILAILLFSPQVRGASCCVGGNAKSFISLARLQKYELGVSTIARQVFGQFNAYGEVAEADRNQTLSIALGGGVRLTEDLQISATVPWVYRQATYSNHGAGDVTLGAQYTALEALFQDDWYPTIHVSGGVKAPSGTVDSFQQGRRRPGTGNGLWEPYFGLAFEKPLGPVTFALRSSYTWRLRRQPGDYGDVIELIESVSYQFDPRLGLALGASQNWGRGNENPDSHARVVNVFISPTYFLTRFWSISAGAEVSLAATGLGANQQATQALTFTTKYGFY